MTEITTVGVDLAKSVFQVFERKMIDPGGSIIAKNGVDADGAVILRRQLRRNQMLEFFQRLGPCLVGMEACAGAHHWARELGKFGHEVRLMPPSYVKPYVRRGKTDQADGKEDKERRQWRVSPTNAICEAVTRPSMRYVPVKSEEMQALLMTHKAREFLVRQLTQVTVTPEACLRHDAIRAHLGEFGIVAPKGVHNVGRLLEAGERADLPAAARVPLRQLADQFFETRDRIDALTKDIRREAEASDAAKRLQTIPGIGPITATALAASVPDTSGFRSARDLSAWLGVRSVSRTDRVPARTAETAFKRRQGEARADFEDG